MNSDDLMLLMRANQETYLGAYNAGYKQGFDDACKQALDILNKPKRKVTKPENGSADL